MIFTIETRDLKILDIHNNNISAYSNKHNYKYIFFNDYKNNLELPVYWWKIQCMLEMLNNSEYEYILWLDSDAFFTDFDVPLETLKHLYWTRYVYYNKSILRWSIFN